MLDIGRRAVLEEVEAEAAPALQRVEVATRTEARQRVCLALEELGMRVDEVPGHGHLPRAAVALLGPGCGPLLVIVVVRAIGVGVSVAVDGDAVRLAIPGADRRPEVVDVVVHVDLLCDPVGHLVKQAAPGGVALEWRAHLEDVEVNGAGGDRLLQLGVVVGLRQVDPADRGPGVVLPWLEEATEQEVVKVLVVESHECQFDILALTLGHVGLGRAQGQLTDRLPVGIGRAAHAHARDRQDLGSHVGVLCECRQDTDR